MRQIKFRGRFVKDDVHNEYIAEDEMLYGGYVELDGKPHIVHKHTMGWIMSEVKPGSVAQLVGYDCDGAEVYEGDLETIQSLFGKRLKAARLAKGLTQQELATRVGFKTYNSIAQYERGINSPTVTTLHCLAKELNCSADWLLGLKEAEPDYWI